MNRMLRKLWNDTKGNTLAIFAAALVPLVVVIGSGLDLSLAYMAKAKLQNACDAASLAARQSMTGTRWTSANETEGRKFFDFNFPAGLMGTQNLSFTIAQDPDDEAQVNGSASADVPTALMHIFGFDTIGIAAKCDAKRDLGHNDVMLVLDTTGSMGRTPSIGGDTKIVRLRTGTRGLYRALEGGTTGSITRFGIMPYSQTVNVGRSLKNRDIIKEQLYATGTYTYQYCDTNGRSVWNCTPTESESRMETGYFEGRTKYRYLSNFEYDEDEEVHINRSSWSGRGGGRGGNRQRFRTSGDACIEERSSIGEGDDDEIVILQSVSAADVDEMPRNGNDDERQFGRYDPGVQNGHTQDACPSEAVKLQEYGSEAEFSTAIDAATARVEGYTYHDIGMLWGARFISRTGMFSSDNPTSIAGIPVNQHIVFMTDGKLETRGTAYSAYGVDSYQDRIAGGGSRDSKHIARFNSVCDLAKSRGITIWVIALDVTDTDDIDDCATSSAHFYTSDGSDLETIFENIGRGIGNLRLTR